MTNNIEFEPEKVWLVHNKRTNGYVMGSSKYKRASHVRIYFRQSDAINSMRKQGYKDDEYVLVEHCLISSTKHKQLLGY